ncbi:hypothetical protein CMUS01_04979 [Colletotrichum musicola]|uniref:Uncharacterized protein n=1 Tax=Colletotrichum musicola TaxID=2175873 RepID=A0A8H6KTU4_9PEZI|nr:hypothetical protein CMUS01_04979 [Colletotrichum musicola]
MESANDGRPPASLNRQAMNRRRKGKVKGPISKENPPWANSEPGEATGGGKVVQGQIQVMARLGMALRAQPRTENKKGEFSGGDDDEDAKWINHGAAAAAAVMVGAECTGLDWTGLDSTGTAWDKAGWDKMGRREGGEGWWSAMAASTMMVMMMLDLR